MRTAKRLKCKIFPFVMAVQAVFFLTGCAAFQLGGEIQQGRLALMYGDPKVALARFQGAAELDPDYLMNFSILPEGVWTYVGRGYYATGNLPEARKALERARSQHADETIWPNSIWAWFCPATETDTRA